MTIQSGGYLSPEPGPAGLARSGPLYRRGAGHPAADGRVPRGGPDPHLVWDTGGPWYTFGVGDAPLDISCQAPVNESPDHISTRSSLSNTGGDYLQEPSETDSRAVRDDPDLKGEFYEGEFVVSQTTIYLIAPDGRVSEIGATQAIFG